MFFHPKLTDSQRQRQRASEALGATRDLDGGPPLPPGFPVVGILHGSCESLAIGKVASEAGDLGMGLVFLEHGFV